MKRFVLGLVVVVFSVPTIGCGDESGSGAAPATPAPAPAAGATGDATKGTLKDPAAVANPHGPKAEPH